MAVLSFAHLKNKKNQDQPFQKSEPTEPILFTENKQSIPTRTTYRIPAVALTACLIAVNYCHGCGRFIRAAPGAMIVGGYGWCLRKGEVGSKDEEWKPIPVSATVEKCRYWLEIIKNEKQESKCKSTNH